MEAVLIFALLEVFCEKIWGGSKAFTMEDINQEFYDHFSLFQATSEAPPPDEMLQNMQNKVLHYHEHSAAQSCGAGRCTPSLSGAFARRSRRYLLWIRAAS